MKRLIFIIDPQSINSLATYDWCMLENIRDIKIHLFGNTDYNEKKFNENVTFSPIFRYNHYDNKILKGLSYAYSLLIILYCGIKERPNVFHLQWIRIWLLDWIFIFFFKRYLYCKFIFTVHNILPRKKTKKTKKHFDKLYNFADLLIVHTETTKINLINIFGIELSKIVVMPHGILNIEVKDSELKNVQYYFENQYKLKDKIIFSSLGVQTFYKGTDLLIEAWNNSKLLSHSSKAVLLIAGKFADLRIPTELADNIIIIPKLLSNAEFKYLLNRTDIMVLPYREIEQSGVLLTLINEGKPYCSTRVGELIKPIESHDIGWIIEECTSSSISSTLEDILNNPESISIKSNNKSAWSKLKDLYSWKKSNEILRKAYLKLL